MSREHQQRALLELHYRTAQKDMQREFMLDHLREVDTVALAAELKRREANQKRN